MAVVGLGNIAQSSVLPAFANSKRAALVALVSRDKSKAAPLARKFKVRAVYDGDEYGACLASPDVSAVYIATPPGTHAELAMRAAEAGKHVLCEKPLAANVHQSRKMVEACRRNRVLLMTAYRKYFEPSSLYLRDLIRNGDLGRIDVIHTGFSELYSPRTSPRWLLDVKLAGGGPLMDLGVYCVNTSRWLVDENPIEVSAHSWRHHSTRFRRIEEGIVFRMSFSSGLTVQGSSTYGAALSSFIHIQGTQGWVSLNPAFPFSEERVLTGKLRGRWVERRYPVTDEFARELDAFGRAVQRGDRIEADGMQGHYDVLIMGAIYKSARIGKPVAVKYV